MNEFELTVPDLYVVKFQGRDENLMIFQQGPIQDFLYNSHLRLGLKFDCN